MNKLFIGLVIWINWFIEKIWAKKKKDLLKNIATSLTNIPVKIFS